MHPAQYLRRKEAGAYLNSRYGHGSPRTLAKLATLGGGPVFRKFGRLVLYDPADLDSWALARLSPPLHSTSDPVRAAAEQSSLGTTPAALARHASTSPPMIASRSTTTQPSAASPPARRSPSKSSTGGGR